MDETSSIGSGASGLWRPQPCRKYNLVHAAAAAALATQAQNSPFVGGGSPPDGVGGMTHEDTATNSEFGASLLRHYSLFNPWKSTLLSSYSNLLGLPQLRPPFLPLGPAAGQYPPGGGGGSGGAGEPHYNAAAAAALMSLTAANQHKSAVAAAAAAAAGNIPASEIVSVGHNRNNHRNGGGKQYRTSPSEAARSLSGCQPLASTSAKSAAPGGGGARSSSSSTSSSSTTNTANGGGQQKTFPCSECGKVFNAHYNLTRHMPVHTGTMQGF